MTTLQKTIKYIAMGLAIVLAIGIISSLVGAGWFITNGFGAEEVKLINNNAVFEDEINKIYIETISDVEIHIGNQIEVDAQNVPDTYKAEVLSNGKLSITTNTKINHLVNVSSNMIKKWGKVVVTIPETLNLTSIEIKNAIGDIKVDDIITNKLFVETGTGDIKMSNATAFDGKINSGVGDFELDDTHFKNFNFDNGVGDIEFSGILEGDSSFKAGVGNIKLEIQGDKSNFDLDIGTGVGSAEINGSKISNDYKIHNHEENSLSVNAGVGDVNIKFR